MKVFRVLIVFFMALFMLGVVSASGNVSDNALGDSVSDISVGNSDKSNLVCDVNKNYSKSTLGDDAVSDNSFAALQSLIDDDTSGIVSLDKDYAFDSSVDSAYSLGIRINKSITVNGNNHSINASGMARIFNITSNGVVLNNLTLFNANSTIGAAIYTNATITVNNSVFRDNVVTRNGAGIHQFGSGNLTISNSVFMNNVAGNYGGAISTDQNDTLNISNVLFMNNTASVRGGAVYQNIYSKLYATNSNFTENSATQGGGIFQNTGSNIIMSDCLFNLNNATNGASIYQYTMANLNDTNSNFTSNIATSGAGVYQDQSSNITLNNSVFSDNSASRGVVIYQALNCNATIINNTFIANNATENSLIYSLTSLRILNSTFTDNTPVNIVYGDDKLNLVNDSYIPSDITSKFYVDGLYAGEYDITDNVFDFNVLYGNHTLNIILNDSVGNFMSNNYTINTYKAITNYTELLTAVDEANLFNDTSDYVLDLDDGVYNVTEEIVWNNSKVHLIINMNNQKISLNNLSLFKVDENAKLTVKKLVVADEELESNPLITNNGIFTLNESVINNITLNNAIILVNNSDAITTLNNNTITNNSLGDNGVINNTGATLLLSKNIINDNKNINQIISTGDVLNDLDVMITASKVESSVYSNVTIKINVTNDYTTINSGNVSLMNGTTVLKTVSVVNGSAEINYTFNSSFEDYLTIQYDGCNVYPNKTAQLEVIIDKLVANIETSNITGFIYENLSFGVNVKDQNSNPVKTGNITISNSFGTIIARDIPVIDGVATTSIIFNKTENLSSYLVVYQDESNAYYSSYKDLPVTINQLTPILSVNNTTGSINAETIIKVNVSDILNNTINNATIIVRDVNGESFAANVSNNMAYIPVTYTDYYNDTLNITFVANGAYTEASTLINLLIKYGVIIEANNSIENPVYGDNSTLEIKVTIDDTPLDGQVNVTLYDNTTTLNLTNGTVNYTYQALSTGILPITIEYLGNSQYNTTSIIKTVMVEKAKTMIAISSTDAVLGQKVTITANITSPNTRVDEGYVVFYIDGEEINRVSVINATATTYYTPDTLKTYDIQAVFIESDNYNSSANTTSMIVTKGTPIIIASIIKTMVYTPIRLPVYVIVDGAIVNDGVIVVSGANMTPVSASVTDGIANISLTFVSAYNGTLNIRYTNSSTYNNQTISIGAKVDKLPVEIQISPIKGVVNSPVEIRSTVKHLNRTINAGTVTFTDVEGNIIGVSNVENNTAKITTNYTAFNNTGNQVLIIQYSGDRVYESNFTTTQVTITKINTTIKNITYNRTSVGSNVSITVNITDSNNRSVSEGQVVIRYNNKIIAQSTVENGIARLSPTFEKLNNTITVEYQGNEKYESSTKSTTISLYKIGVIISVSNIKAYINDTVQINATLRDVHGNVVRDGIVYFRINRTNMQYPNGTDVTANVVNGVARVNYTVPLSWYVTTSIITAYYNGTHNTSSSLSANNTIRISLREAKLTFFTDSDTYYVGDTVNIRVVVSNNENKLINEGRVTFKFNDVTIKYSNGTPIQYNVVNGMVTLKYTLPTAYVGGNYTLSIVFGGGIYRRTEVRTSIKIVKVDTHITVDPIIATTKQTRIYAVLYDGYNKKITTKTQISIKINGVTFKTYNITNGVINVTIPTNFATGLYDVTIIAGEGQLYKQTRVETKLLKT